MKNIPGRAKAPAIISALCGGSALGWMMWHNGIAIFGEWYFYPSLALFIAIVIYLIGGSASVASTRIWQCVWLWSGVWALLFILSFAAISFSLLIVGNLVGPMLESARIGPFSAAFLHIFIWACATDILKSHRKDQKAQQVSAPDRHPPRS